MVRWPLLLASVLVEHVRSAVISYLSKIRILMKFAAPVMVSYATVMIIVNSAMTGLTRDGVR